MSCKPKRKRKCRLVEEVLIYNDFFMSRQKGSINNLIWGVVSVIITSVVAFIIPRLFIVNYGSEVNGLLASIRQIYVYLALLEAGVGSASVVALYGPMGRGDKHSVNSILAATNHYYKKIGIIYALCIVVAGILYPFLLDTDIPYYICSLVIILQGAGSVMGYLVYGKYNMLLRVDNRSYVTIRLGMILSVLTDVVRIALVMNGQSIIEVQATYFFFGFLNMGYICWYIKKYYPWIDLSVKPDFEAISQKSSVFVHQISSLVFSHTDVLILTFVCGLKTVSIYTMYAAVYGILESAITITGNSVQSALGQTFNTDRVKFMKIQAAFETYYLAFVFSLFTVAGIFILPFMALYTAGADMNYVYAWIPVLFTLYQLMSYGRVTSNNIIGFAAEFKSTRWRAWLETVINLVVSLVCVFQFGIYGVLMGTVAAVFYRANDIILFANHRVLKQSAWPTYRRWIVNAVLLTLTILFFRYIPMNTDTYITLILNALWVSIVVFILFFGINSWTEKEARKTASGYLKNMLPMLPILKYFYK